MLLCAVEPPNKGHVRDNINSAVLSFIERLSSFRGSQCPIGKIIFGTSNSVHCREVYYTVSLFRRVHYRRFHCIYTHSPCTCVHVHIHACIHIYNVYVHIHACTCSHIYNVHVHVHVVMKVV